MTVTYPGSCNRNQIGTANSATFDPDNTMAGSGGGNIANFTWTDTHF